MKTLLWKWKIILLNRTLCLRRRCAYYKSYLMQGPADMTHPEYHEAEQLCVNAQERIDRWMDDNPNAKEIPNYLLRIADYYERRIRA